MIIDWLEQQHARRTFITSMAKAVGAVVVASAIPTNGGTILANPQGVIPFREHGERGEIYPAAAEKLLRNESIILRRVMLFDVGGQPVGRWTFNPVATNGGDLTLNWNGLFELVE